MDERYSTGPVPAVGKRLYLTMVEPRDPSATVEGFFGERLDETLVGAGALLFRGFPLASDEDFSALVDGLAREQLQYQERSTRRTKTAGNVYTSTEYPAEKNIAAHSENSFQSTVPGKILFFARQASSTGGETPIASNTEILARLDPEVLCELRDRGLRYVRNFDGGFDMSWQEAFQTDNRGAVEEYCARNRIDFEWVSAGHLRTSQARPATRRHPLTRAEVWFNQLHLFHPSNLDAAIRRALEDSLGPDGLPRNALFGDGKPLGDALVEHVRATIAASESAFPWQAGDVLIADNLLVSHGRRPYTGPRAIRVALVDPIEFPEA
jgi:alpha-ketoglutarate-dependent taurine dioxygenase